MPQGLKRYYGSGDLHFITCSCYQRRAWLGTGRRRDLFLRLLEQTWQKYCFVVVGYAVMQEHLHLLISEPQVGDPSKLMQVVKQPFRAANSAAMAQAACARIAVRWSAPGSPRFFGR